MARKGIGRKKALESRGKTFKQESFIGVFVAMLYTTNTTSQFLLDGVTVKNNGTNDFLMRCSGNQNGRGWGSVGSNGATTNFTARKETMEGAIEWDYASKLDTYLVGSSTWTGAVNLVTDDQGTATSGHAKRS